MLGFAPLGRLAFGQNGPPPGFAADAASFALSGKAAGLSASVSAQPATFTVSGVPAGLVYLAVFRVNALVGDFAATGRSATFRFTMPAGAGEFSASGQGVTFAFAMRAATGAFSVSSPPVFVSRRLILSASWQPARTVRGHFLYAPLGGAVLGGGVASEAPATTFRFDGQNSAFAVERFLDAAVGAFVFSGKAAVLNYAGYSPRVRVFPSAGRGARGVSRGTEPIRVFAATGHGARRRAFGG